MGYDVTYHPITPEEMNEWYFEPLAEPPEGDEAVDRLAKKYAFEADNYRRFLKTVRRHLLDMTGYSFELSHGYMLAAAQGLFRRYDYFRGSMVSALVQVEPEYRRYTQHLWEIVPDEYRKMEFSGGIECNYCGGVYISPKQVSALLRDISEDDKVNNDFCDLFGDEEELERFLDLLRYAEKNGFGVLEATDVVVPFAGTSQSDFDNCENDFMDPDRVPSEKTLSIAPFLIEPYDPSKEEHDGKYFLDEDGDFHENPNGDGVTNEFNEEFLDNVRKMMAEQTPEQREKLVKSVKTKPGKELEVRLQPAWNLVLNCGCMSLLFFALACFVIPFTHEHSNFTILATLAGITLLAVATVASSLVNYCATTVLKSIEIGEHPVRLGKDTKLCVTLQGPWLPGPRRLRRLSVDLICKELVVAEKIMQSMEAVLYRQTIFVTEGPLHLDTEPLVFGPMTFRCDTVPSLNPMEGRVSWEFVVSGIEQGNRCWELEFPFAVVQE